MALSELYGTVCSSSKESKMFRVSSCSSVSSKKPESLGSELEFGLSCGSLALTKFSRIFWSLLKAIIGGFGNFSVSCLLPSIKNQYLFSALCKSRWLMAGL